MESQPMRTQEKRRHLLTYVKYMCPSLFDLSVYSLCVIVSGMMTSRWINATAMGAVSVASPYISITYAYALIFGVGGATVISIYRGQGNVDAANRLFTMNLVFMASTTLLLGLFGFMFAEPVARLLGATPDNFAYVVKYLRVTTLFTLSYGLCYTLSMMIKADGHPLLGLLGSSAGSALNLGMLFVLTRWAEPNIASVALASALGQCLISAIYLCHFFTKRATLKFVSFRFDFKEIGRIVSIGFPDALSEASSGIFVLLFNYIVFRRLGEAGIIAFSVVNYINLLTVQMTLGITQGMQPLVSFSHGKNDMALRSLYLRFARVFASIIGIAVFAVCMIWTKGIVSKFIPPEDAQTFAMGVFALKTFAWFLPLVGISVVSIGYFSAIEQQRRSRILSLFRGIAGIALFGLVLPALLGQAGIWLAPAVTEAFTALMAILFLINSRKNQK